MYCPICKNINLDFVYEFIDGSAMQNRLCDSLKDSLDQEKAKVTLYICKNCGFIFNADFDARKTKYSSDYDNTQENFLYFEKYLKKIARRLIKKYNLKNKNIAEIGCGKGGFLELLYQSGVRKVKGFDPSYSNRKSLIDRLVMKKYFNVKNIKNKVDFIICRHVLEHIPNPIRFMSSVEKCLKNKGTMYIELPSLEWIIKNKAFFDFFYEHCNYFTKKSLVILFSRLGFKNIIFNYGLKGQYFQLEISRFPERKNFSIPESCFLDLDKISKFIREEIYIYRKVINGLSNFAVWGAGAKGATFLSRLKISRSKCPYVIDINPNKQNKFIPITGQKVVSPEIFKENKIKTIIIMNSIYEKEIKNISQKYNYKGKFILL